MKQLTPSKELKVERELRKFDPLHSLSFFRDFVDRTQQKRELTGRRLAALIQGGPPIVVDRSHAVP